MLPTAWPEELRKLAPDLCGAIVAVEPLVGLSGAAVWRLTGQYRSVVVKRCTQREASLYRRADTLNAAGVTLPALLWTGALVDGAWIVIEYLPGTPPRAVWLANPGWMQVLARLHRLPATVLAGVHEPFRPRWSTAMTGAALELVTADQRGRLRAQAGVIAEATQGLQQVVQPISGDPNPRNWGLRSDGAAVLFDWERVGFGPPAFDLAITIPGLGSRSDAERVAQAYLAATGLTAPPATAVEPLARDIMRCKAWVVVEFMATAVTEQLELDPAYAQLWRAVPDWLALNLPEQ